MDYIVRQTMFSLVPKYTIQDSQGRNMYSCSGKLLGFGGQLDFSAGEENILLFLQRVWLSFQPQWKIYRDGCLYATVKRMFSLKANFVVQFADGRPPLQVDGDFFRYEFVFSQEGHTVASVSKKLLTITDTYGVRVLGQAHEEHPFILACVIIIDKVSHPRRRSFSFHTPAVKW